VRAESWVRHDLLPLVHSLERGSARSGSEVVQRRSLVGEHWEVTPGALVTYSRTSEIGT
jgi:hypothetical protein